jgi:hypothetical protein
MAVQEYGSDYPVRAETLIVGTAEGVWACLIIFGIGERVHFYELCYVNCNSLVWKYS